METLATNEVFINPTSVFHPTSCAYFDDLLENDTLDAESILLTPVDTYGRSFESDSLSPDSDEVDHVSEPASVDSVPVHHEHSQEQSQDMLVIESGAQIMIADDLFEAYTIDSNEHCGSGDQQLVKADANLTSLGSSKDLLSPGSKTTFQVDKSPALLENTSGFDNALPATDQSLATLEIESKSRNQDENSPTKTVTWRDDVSQKASNPLMLIKSSATIKEIYRNDHSKNEKRRNLLEFPPCVICSSKATGWHYGALTCEACKGFFRRYLQKKIEYKCPKGGNCQILSCNRGNANCSGCRLKKCLSYGMSKEKSRMGRYNLSKRTQAIIEMNIFKGKKENGTSKPSLSLHCAFPVEEGRKLPSQGSKTVQLSCSLHGDCFRLHVIQNVENLNRSEGFSDMLVSELVKALDELEAYGPNYRSKEQIIELHKYHFERFQQKTKLFGRMKRVPREEYNKLYREFGIDIDGRIADWKKELEDFEDCLKQYYNFAKHIPGFYSLSVGDQAKLLKFSMNEFFTVVMLDGYHNKYETFLGRNGQGYHFEEIADREYPRKLCTFMKEVICRWQLLGLSEAEVALIGALTLVFTDRCKLEDNVRAEKIQLEITNLLRRQLQKEYKSNAHKRFTKIIDALVITREMSDLLTKEHNMMCTDDLYVREIPCLKSLVLEENE